MTYEEMEERFDREDISLAPLDKRVWAFFIDDIIVAFLFLISYHNRFENAMSIENTILVVNSLVIPYIILKVLYQAFFVWMYGATVGKIICKIKVINPLDFSKPNLAQAFLRAFVRIFSEGFFYLGFIWAYMTPKRETWQDILAKTLVINA